MRTQKCSKVLYSAVDSMVVTEGRGRQAQEAAVVVYFAGAVRGKVFRHGLWKFYIFCKVSGVGWRGILILAARV